MGLRLIVIVLIATLGLAQSQDLDSPFRPEFEVVSIKPDDGKIRRVSVVARQEAHCQAVELPRSL